MRAKTVRRYIDRITAMLIALPKKIGGMPLWLRVSMSILAAIAVAGLSFSVFVFFFEALKQIVHGPGWSWGMFWQAAAAVATALAAGVALWMGWREGGWRRAAVRDRRFQASLYALSREEWIKDASKKLDAMLSQFSEDKVGECFADPQRLSRDFSEIISLLDDIDKEKIALVDSRGAYNLVKAIGVLQYLEHDQRGGRETWVPHGKLRSYHGLLSSARDSLEIVMRVLIVLGWKVNQELENPMPSVDRWL